MDRVTNRLRTGCGALESVSAGMLGQAFLLVSGVLVARMLGPEDRGNLAMLVVLGVLSVQVVLCGIPQGLTYYLSIRRTPPARLFAIVRQAAGYQCAFAIALCALFYYLYLLNKELSIFPEAIVAMIALPGGVLIAYGFAGLAGSMDLRWFHFLRVVQPAVWAVAVIMLWLTGADTLFDVMLTWSLVQLAVSWLAWRRFSSVVSLSEPGNDRGSRREHGLSDMLRYGAKGMMGYLSPIDTFRVDQIVVGFVLSPAALGLYVVAQAFTSLPRLIAQSIGLVAFPVLASGGGRTLPTGEVLRYMGIANVVMLPLAGAIFFFMPELVNLLFGVAFLGSVTIARTLLIAAVFVANRRLVGEILRGLGHPQVSSWIEVSSAPILVLCAAVALPSYGALGMAASVAMTHFLGCVISLVFLGLVISRDGRACNE